MKRRNFISALIALAIIPAACSCAGNGRKEKAEVKHPGCPYPIEVFDTPNGSVEIYCINHGSVAISFKADIAKDSRTILIDPVGEYKGTTVDYSSVPKGDIILVTHEHVDHLDASTIEARSAKNAVLILNQSSYDQIGKGEVMHNGDSRSLSSAITLEAVPAYNSTAKNKQFHPKGNGNGYILKIDGLKVYVAGDTEPYTGMKKFGNIDVALLPVNQPYTMTIDQCVKAAKMIKPGFIIPYHMGDTDLEALSNALTAKGFRHVMHEELK
ncbi:MAG: MBL fold metallo-hydrolase [Bacteroidales bacterium]|nr:MBL fold metallo-hydrolase [Candidatus Cryptobacteroides caccocaballi]